MTSTTSMTFVERIEQATIELSDPLTRHDPDGLAVREALLLAERAVSITDTWPDAVSGRTASSLAAWQRFYVAVADAVAQLQVDVPDPAILPDTIRPESDSANTLRPALVTLTRRLADLFAEAVLSDGWSPWRRLVWAQIAHRLDDAAAALTDEEPQ